MDRSLPFTRIASNNLCYKERMQHAMPLASKQNIAKKL